MKTAEKHLRNATELSDGNIEAHLNLGRALHNLNRSTEAVAQFDKVIALDPKTPLAWFHRGMVLQSLGELDQAIADLTTEIKLNPEYPPSYFFRGRALMTKGEWNEALAGVMDGRITHAPTCVVLLKARFLLNEQATDGTRMKHGEKTRGSALLRI